MPIRAHIINDEICHETITVSSPIDITVLGPQKPGKTRLLVRNEITIDDAKTINDYFKDYEITICISDFTVNDSFEYLKYITNLKRIDIQKFEFVDFESLKQLPAGLESIRLSQNKSTKLDLGFLERYQNLRELHIERHCKSIESIAKLQKLESLMLRSITLDSLDFLLPLKSLRSLDIKLGGTKNLDALPSIGKIEYLELWQIKGISDLGAIAETTTLQTLFLDRLKNVTLLPSFKHLTELRTVILKGMHGLSDFSAIAEAPNIQQLVITEVTHLETSDFECLLNNKSIKNIRLGLGTKRNEKIVNHLNSIAPTRFSFD